MSDVNLARRCDASGSGRMKYEKKNLQLCPFASKDEPVSSLFPLLVCAVSGLSFDCRRLSASYTLECIHQEREGIKALLDKLRPGRLRRCVVPRFSPCRLAPPSRFFDDGFFIITFPLFFYLMAFYLLCLIFVYLLGGHAIHALLLTVEIAFCLTLHPLLK